MPSKRSYAVITSLFLTGMIGAACTPAGQISPVALALSPTSPPAATTTPIEKPAAPTSTAELIQPTSTPTPVPTPTLTPKPIPTPTSTPFASADEVCDFWRKYVAFQEADKRVGGREFLGEVVDKAFAVPQYPWATAVSDKIRAFAEAQSQYINSGVDSWRVEANRLHKEAYDMGNDLLRKAGPRRCP